MRLHSNQILYSPSDLGNFVACEHLTQLELAAALGESARPNVSNAYVDLIKRKGEEHEKSFLEALRAEGHLPHRQIILLDSDGSVLMLLSALTTLGLYPASNLKVLFSTIKPMKEPAANPATHPGWPILPPSRGARACPEPKRSATWIHSSPQPATL
jgi:hypothetical protein